MQAGYCVDCGRRAVRGSNRCPEHEEVPLREMLRPRRPREGVPTWQWILIVSVIGVSAVVGYLILGQGAEPTPVSLERYAAIVCNRDGTRGPTWGSTRDFLRADLNARKGLSPPEEMREWHETKIAVLELTIDALDKYDADEPVNAMLLLGNPVMYQAADMDEAAGRSLPIDTRRELYRLGCTI